MFTRKVQLCSLLIITLLSMLIAGCGGGSSDNGQVTGKVTAANGAAIANVTVTSPSGNTTSDASGVYTIDVPAGTSAVISFAKAPYLTTGIPVTVAKENLLKLDVKLVVAGSGISVTGLTSGVQTATDTNTPRADGLNASVVLPTNSILDASNNPVNAATITITTNLPKDAAFLDAFPGSFFGTPIGGGANVSIQSFGFVDVTLGTGLHLDAAVGATLIFPIDPGNDPGTATVPIWSIDPATGIWKEDGVANRDTTVNPNVYRAHVTHFSPYNLDKPFTGTTLNFKAVDQADPTKTLAGVTIVARATAGSDNPVWKTVVITDADGLATVIYPPSPNGVNYLNFTASLGDRSAWVGLLTDNPVIVTVNPPTTFSALKIIAKDAAGLPVAGATVTGFMEGNAMGGLGPLDTLTTDANGEATYPRLPNDTYIMVNVVKGALHGNGNWQPYTTSRTVNITMN